MRLHEGHHDQARLAHGGLILGNPCEWHECTLACGPGSSCQLFTFVLPVQATRASFRILGVAQLVTPKRNDVIGHVQVCCMVGMCGQQDFGFLVPAVKQVKQAFCQRAGFPGACSTQHGKATMWGIWTDDEIDEALLLLVEFRVAEHKLFHGRRSPTYRQRLGKHDVEHDCVNGTLQALASVYVSRHLPHERVFVDQFRGNDALKIIHVEFHNEMAKLRGHHLTLDRASRVECPHTVWGTCKLQLHRHVRQPICAPTCPCSKHHVFGDNTCYVSCWRENIRLTTQLKLHVPFLCERLSRLVVKQNGILHALFVVVTRQRVPLDVLMIVFKRRAKGKVWFTRGCNLLHRRRGLGAASTEISCRHTTSLAGVICGGSGQARVEHAAMQGNVLLVLCTWLVSVFVGFACVNGWYSQASAGNTPWTHLAKCPALPVSEQNHIVAQTSSTKRLCDVDTKPRRLGAPHATWVATGGQVQALHTEGQWNGCETQVFCLVFANCLPTNVYFCHA
eukprot:m.388583 g.388583  ORF g.388583 m.388583 type:complete len:506 (-) comp20069_c0_seq4:647-2164(-)